MYLLGGSTIAALRKRLPMRRVLLCRVFTQRRKRRHLLAWQTTEMTFSLDT